MEAIQAIREGKALLDDGIIDAEEFASLKALALQGKVGGTAHSAPAFTWLPSYHNVGDKLPFLPSPPQ